MLYPIKTINSFRHSTDEYYSFGSTPSDEECLQVGEASAGDMVRECSIFIEQLKRVHGAPPEGCSYFILENHHDFGTYFEAAVRFNPEKEEAAGYALAVEAGLDRWDEESRRSLRLANLPYKKAV